MKSPENDWFVQTDPRPRASVRLLCFPYAGGNITTYMKWAGLLPPWIEPTAVHLPGRGFRLRQPPIRRFSQLIDALFEQIDAGMRADDRPVAFFGHSLGALIAWELALELREQGRRQPCHLFLSGHHAPTTPPPRTITGDLPRQALMDIMRLIYGTDPRVLASRELVALILPVLRADLDVLNSWQHRHSAPLGLPSTVLYGSTDPIGTREHVEGWRREFTAPPRLYELSGGHLFVDRSPARVCEIAALELKEFAE